jgi:hypothetical protein
MASRGVLLPHFEELQIARCLFSNLPERSEGHWGDGLTAANGYVPLAPSFPGGPDRVPGMDSGPSITPRPLRGNSQ